LKAFQRPTLAALLEEIDALHAEIDAEIDAGVARMRTRYPGIPPQGADR
jgi:hypothetical protein